MRSVLLAFAPLVALGGCLQYTPMSACPAYAPAHELTDRLMETFNAGNSPVYAGKYPDGWHHSAWTDRRVVTCGPTEAYMRALGFHYRADGSKISRIDVRYGIALQEAGWRFVGRSANALP
ncbi:MAG TPA: hypothetical protein VGO52_08740 [Hyphomonadaceae bacterium]|jgi:hypothetical protein|nr:hypothetical protein [Hyphomonadaceae bacterium]